MSCNYRYLYNNLYHANAASPARRLLVVLAFLATSLFFCLCLVPSSVAAAQAECHTTDNESHSHGGDGGGSCGAATTKAKEQNKGYYSCGMYLAESKIPNAGWGLFAGAKGYRVGDPFPHDVAIVASEAPGHDKRPRWKLSEYVWGAEETRSNFDADPSRALTVSVLPGVGSLANSHTRLFNVQTSGDFERRPILRSNASAGAFSHCQGHHFVATDDIAPGHEIFSEYGDIWFEHRYPDQPRRTDYEVVDEMLSSYKKLLQVHRNNMSGDLAAQMWKDVASTSHQMNERIRSIMPQTYNVAIAGALHPNGLAGATSTYFRPIEWLEQHGMCLDHLQGKPSDHVPYQNGAFVKRPFQEGERLTPVPVIPISRQHLNIERDGLARQLLLNYCYGHPESNLLLFPGGPVVNLINHAGGINHTDGAAKVNANVALRWSPLNDNTHLQRSVDEILTESGIVLLLELYALRDLEAGEEVLLDYGLSFEMAWQRHEREWQVSPPIHSRDYQPPSYFEELELLFTKENGENKYPPPHIQPRCWVDMKATEHLEVDEDGCHPFVPATSGFLHSTTPCDILLTPDYHETYRVMLYKNSYSVNKEPICVKDVPRGAITFVDKPYQGHQFLRRAFRREIHLSDELFPEAWKDRAAAKLTCQLYMAESTIPNSTAMGVYTAQPIASGDHIHFGDVAVPVIDYQQNSRLRRLYHKSQNETTEHLWLIDSFYYRIREVAFEANDSLSIIPGLGMLANSHHSGAAINAKVGEPIQATPLHRAHDAGAGGSSYYHNALTSATKVLEAGEELFFEHFGEERGNYVAKTIPTETRARSENPLRSIEWLEANGRCLDNIRPGESKIFQAGYGAFATRRISKGAVVVPMPVVPILRRHLELFESDESKHGVTRIHYLGQQLLINYCYGYPNSSLLFFPYSPVVNYVNHNSIPNSKLRWSSLSSHKRQWERSPVEVAGEANAGLLMELVALRDIMPSEEVFLDYGDIWAQKWQEYESGWRPPEGEASYVPAWRLNMRMEWLRTEEELKTNPYPFKNVWTACAVGPARTLAQGSSKVFRWFYQSGTSTNTSFFLPCDILERDVRDADLTEVMDRRESIFPLEAYYKVLVYEEDKTTSAFVSVPRKAIRFFDTAYSTDLFLHKAFRHDIQLPDEMVSEAWRDLK